MAKTLYDYWFVQFDFPCLPENYSYARFAKAGEFSGASKPENFESVLTYSQVGGLPLPDGKKWFVYIIECVDGTFYKGMTNDLYRRYYEHKTGQGAEWTKIHKPKKVIHYEEFDTQQEAAKREKELKTGYGRTWLKREYEKYQKGGNGLPALKDGNGSPALKDGNGSPALKDGNGSPALKEGNGSPAPECKLRTAGKMVFNKKLKREIPEGWEVKEIGKILNKRNDTSKKIQSKDILNSGNYPVITQDSGSLISGYTDETSPITNLPLIIFGDHSCTLRYVNFPFFRGADGTQILNFGSSLVFYIYLFLESVIIQIPNYGKYERHFKYIKDLKVVIPPKNNLINFQSQIQSSLDKIEIIRQENQKLTELRDWLLPMLMNGQVAPTATASFTETKN